MHLLPTTMCCKCGKAATVWVNPSCCDPGFGYTVSSHKPYCQACRPDVVKSWPLPDAPLVIDGWTLASKCPKCGMPIWAKPNPEAPDEGHLGEFPWTERSCTCP